MGEPTTYLELIEYYNNYRESRTGKVMSAMIEKLNTMAKILLKRHDINCRMNAGKHMGRYARIYRSTRG
jgi:hypothetical protein